MKLDATQLPEALRHRIYCLRAFVHFRKAGAGMIHVPKSAGTSFARFLYGRSLGHFTLAEYHGTLGPLSSKVPLFGILRDPLDRFASAYRFFRMGGTDDAGINLHSEQADLWKENLDLFIDEYLMVTPDGARDYVFRSQVNFVDLPTEPAGESICLFRLYDMPKIKTWLADKTGKNVDIPHANRSDDDALVLTTSQKQKIQDLYCKDQDLYDRL